MTEPTSDAVETLNRTFVKGSLERRQSIDEERKILDNQAAIELLDEWFSEPDNMGREWWDEYEQDIAKCRAANYRQAGDRRS